MTIDGASERTALDSKAHNNTKIAEVVEDKGIPAMRKDITDIDDGKGGKRAITLRDLIGAPYHDARWDTLLDRLSFDEMLELVNNGAFQTASIVSIDKNLTNDSDGPIGFVNFMPGKQESYKGNTTFACEILIGTTWNKDLAYQMGKNVGENGIWGDVDGMGFLIPAGMLRPSTCIVLHSQEETRVLFRRCNSLRKACRKRNQRRKDERCLY